MRQPLVMKDGLILARLRSRYNSNFPREPEWDASNSHLLQLIWKVYQVQYKLTMIAKEPSRLAVWRLLWISCNILEKIMFSMDIIAVNTEKYFSNILNWKVKILKPWVNLKLVWLYESLIVFILTKTYVRNKHRHLHSDKYFKNYLIYSETKHNIFNCYVIYSWYVTYIYSIE